MNVAILTIMNPQCGFFQYAQDLERELGRHCGVLLTDSITQTQGSDALVVNWHPIEVGISAGQVRKIQESGTKVVLIYHQSFEDGSNENPELLATCDAVVAHEPGIDGTVYIPHGIPEVSDLPEPYADMVIGTAGFLSEMKRADIVVEAAHRLDGIANIVAPAHRINAHYLPRALAQWRAQLGNRLWLETSLLPKDDVVRRLARSTVNVFWFQSMTPYDRSGQSGSVRMGLAARRPTIVSTHRKFKTLFPYENEIYVAETEDDVYRLISEIRHNIQDRKTVKIPSRVIADQGWSVTGTMYMNLIENIVGR